MTVAQRRSTRSHELRARSHADTREHVVEIDVPGARVADLHVELRGHIAWVRAGEKARGIRLPDGVDTAGLTATYGNGVLRLSAPCARLTTRVITVEDATPCVHADVAPI